MDGLQANFILPVLWEEVGAFLFSKFLSVGNCVGRRPLKAEEEEGGDNKRREKGEKKEETRDFGGIHNMRGNIRRLAQTRSLPRSVLGFFLWGVLNDFEPF